MLQSPAVRECVHAPPLQTSFVQDTPSLWHGEPSALKDQSVASFAGWHDSQLLLGFVAPCA
jgi:hypothetical protein